MAKRGPDADAEMGAEEDDWLPLLERPGKRSRGTTYREYALHLVSNLAGTTPDQAVACCEEVLKEFEDTISASATRHASIAAAKCPETPEGLHSAKHQLMRAVHFLAARCRRERANAEEIQVLRAQLAESQEREAQSKRINAYLQECLRVQMAPTTIASHTFWAQA